jgi:hypothetical protein
LEVSVQQERDQGRVGGEGDRGAGSGGEDLRGRGGEAGGRVRADGWCAEEQVFGPVEDPYETVGAWWRGAREAELAGGDGAVVGGAGAEFGPAEQAGGVGVGGGGGDLAGRAGLAELAGPAWRSWPPVRMARSVLMASASSRSWVTCTAGDVQGGQEF